MKLKRCSINELLISHVIATTTLLIKIRSGAHMMPFLETVGSVHSDRVYIILKLGVLPERLHTPPLSKLCIVLIYTLQTVASIFPSEATMMGNGSIGMHTACDRIVHQGI